ncbi:phenylalanine--tRNA ligase subunit beta [Peptoniphilus sp. GNH]|nr:phenylalanine--tRNA ligase, beta subunit [Clostridiales bacterium KA00134]UHR03392.1 phenylalanine--tRNA ligase subunit beta [Peptoniphilus sp. GNH]
MLLPVKWLKDYVDINLDAKTIANKITDTGSHVESINFAKGDMSNVVVGKIKEISPHPDADKLQICKIDIGKEILQVVTGAQNIFVGALVALALVGARLAKGQVIEKGNLRGVESDGMLCSLEELGFDSSVISKKHKDGIFIFNEDLELGTDVFKALYMDEAVIDIEITPNRSDCLSIIGMARETAATFDLKLHEPLIEVKEEAGPIANMFDGVEVESDKCSRFYGRIIEDIKIEESPLWIQNYLMSVGIRPINNIVDLTNLVMVEYGQPLHAYDLVTLKTKKIIVKDAKEDEVFETLDGIKRNLCKGDILITDGEKTIGLAGIMGGLETEVESTSKAIFIEGAHFDEDTIRASSKRLGLRTEASARFEKGVCEDYAQIAVDRMASLVEKLGYGKVAKSSFDVRKNSPKSKVVNLRIQKTKDLMGCEISGDEIVKLLERLQIKAKEEGPLVVCQIPNFRPDLSIEEDLIEEVSRIYGFDRITPKPLEGKLTRGGKSKSRRYQEKIKRVLLALGYNEYMSFSFIGESDLNKLRLEEDSELRNCVEIINPLGEEFKIMRRTLIPSMLEILSRNYARKNSMAAGFEFGNVFIKTEEKLPKEEIRLCLGTYSYHDFYQMKEDLELALRSLGLENLTYKRSKKSYLHPGRSAEIFFEDESLGDFGELHPSVLKNYGIKSSCLIADIDFEKIIKHDFSNYTFKELPKHPAMKRDYAIVVDEDLEVYEIEKIVRSCGKELVESFDVFDIYKGEHVESGKKSVAFSIVFRHPDRTLVEKEVKEITDKILSDIEEQLGGKLRS